MIDEVYMLDVGQLGTIRRKLEQYLLKQSLKIHEGISETIFLN